MYEEWIRRQLAQAPPLGDEQRAAIVVLLSPVPDEGKVAEAA